MRVALEAKEHDGVAATAGFTNGDERENYGANAGHARMRLHDRAAYGADEFTVVNDLGASRNDPDITADALDDGARGLEKPCVDTDLNEHQGGREGDSRERRDELATVV